VTGAPEQDGFTYRFGWGPDGLAALAPEAAVVVVVDVLRFTSAVSAAVESGATVIPARWRDERAAAFAASSGAVLAGRREDGGPSLSPTDLLTLRPGTRLVLPSPNGASVAATARQLTTAPVLAGCVRNAGATARRARELAGGGPIAVIASGERTAAGGLRLAVEDLLGAGAVLRALDPAAAVSAARCSPDAAAARAAFVGARPLVAEHLLGCTSGRELVAIGFADDVHTAAAYDVTDVAAQMVDGAFVGV
jgi:2-phosphosulfolactate phosphatase